VVCQETSMRPISTLDLLGLQCQMTPQLSGEIRDLRSSLVNSTGMELHSQGTFCNRALKKYWFQFTTHFNRRQGHTDRLRIDHTVGSNNMEASKVSCLIFIIHNCTAYLLRTFYIGLVFKKPWKRSFSYLGGQIMEFSLVQSEDKWSHLYHSRNLHVLLATRILADVLVVMAAIIITHIRY